MGRGSAMSSVSLALRLAGIALGIASAVLMGQKAFGFTFDNDFIEALRGVENFVGTVVWPFELLLVKPAVKWLHEQGFVFELQSHWRQGFVLLWLYLASIARAGAGQTAQLTAFAWLRAVLIAGTFGVLAGTVPLSDTAVFWWPVSGYFLAVAIDYAWNTTFGRYKGWTWSGQFGRDGLLSLVLAVCCILAAVYRETVPFASNPAIFWSPFLVLSLYYVGLAASEGGFFWPQVIGAAVYAALAARLVAPLNLLLETSPSPGLASLAAVVVIEGGVRILIGAYHRNGDGDAFWQKWLGDRTTRVGLDMLFVLGGATAIIYVAHQMAQL